LKVNQGKKEAQKGTDCQGNELAWLPGAETNGQARGSTSAACTLARWRLDLAELVFFDHEAAVRPEV